GREQADPRSGDAPEPGNWIGTRFLFDNNFGETSPQVKTMPDWAGPGATNMAWNPFRSLRPRKSARRNRAFPLGSQFGSERLEGRCVLSTLPAGFTESLVVGGLKIPTAMDIAPDG